MTPEFLEALERKFFNLPPWILDCKVEVDDGWSSYEDSYWLYCFSYKEKLYFFEECYSAGSGTSSTENKAEFYDGTIQECTLEKLIELLDELEEVKNYDRISFNY